jgi:beta-galactosidase
VVLRVTDEFGAIRPYTTTAIQMRMEGPAQLIGDNPFVLAGGRGAVWIRAGERPGKIRLTATHPDLGAKAIEIATTEAPEEAV